MKKGNGNLVFPAVKNPKPCAVAIYCLDPRFSDAFDGFIKEGLDLQRWEVIPIIIAGGPAPLAHQKEMSTRARMLIRQLIFLFEHFPSIKRVIAIGHQDCGYYKVIPDKGNTVDREKDDLKGIIFSLGLFVPEGVTIEAHYAYFADKGRTKIAFQS